MKGDFSRDTFDKHNHFSRVLMQQGRVQLDADWNEQADILLHYLRTLAVDLIGPSGTPAGAAGFGIARSQKPEDGFTIGTGRYYVDGMLCENDGAETVTYVTQKDYPFPPTFAAGNIILVYLDVWERYISAIEKDEIREEALGGPDTTGRSQVVWQVKFKDISEATITFKDDQGKEQNAPNNVASMQNAVIWRAVVAKLFQRPHRGYLQAQVDPPKSVNTPCLTAPDAKYRGTENQLYRVEIHRGGQVGIEGPKPTFKWSRDNGAVASVCVLQGNELMIDNPQAFAANQWVELLGEGQELRGEPGTMVKVIRVDGDKLLLAEAVSPPQGLPEDESKVWPNKARRWDHVDRADLKLDEGAIPIAESPDKWTDLEEGVQIQFLPAPEPVGGGENEGDNVDVELKDNMYRTGDYWLIPARVATGSIEWPTSEQKDKDGKTVPIPQPPRGITHHYAPLALLSQNEPEDCRRVFSTAPPPA